MATTIDPKLAARLRATETHVFEALKKRAERRRAEDFFIVPDENGQPLYAFKLHNLWQEEYDALRKKHSPVRRDNDTGLELPGPIDLPKYQSEVIHMATDAEDRAVLWDNPEQRQAYGVTSNLDVIERMLGGPGIKALVIARIDMLGGYGAPMLGQAELEKLLGNSSAPAAGAPSSTASTNGTE